jgi:hypothetical protein
VQRFSAIPDKGGVSGVPAQRINAPPIKPAATTATATTTDADTTAGDDSSAATAGAAAAEQSELTVADAVDDSCSTSSGTVPYTSAELQKRLRVVPVKDLRQVRIVYIPLLSSIHANGTYIAITTYARNSSQLHVKALCTRLSVAVNLVLHKPHTRSTLTHSSAVALCTSAHVCQLHSSGHAQLCCC